MQASQRLAQRRAPSCSHRSPVRQSVWRAGIRRLCRAGHPVCPGPVPETMGVSCWMLTGLHMHPGDTLLTGLHMHPGATDCQASPQQIGLTHQGRNEDDIGELSSRRVAPCSRCCSQVHTAARVCLQGAERTTYGTGSLSFRFLWCTILQLLPSLQQHDVWLRLHTSSVHEPSTPAHWQQDILSPCLFMRDTHALLLCATWQTLCSHTKVPGCRCQGSF